MGVYLANPATNWAPGVAATLGYHFLFMERRRNTTPPYNSVPTYSTGIARLLLTLTWVLGYLLYTGMGELHVALFVLGGVALSYLASIVHLLGRASRLGEDYGLNWGGSGFQH